MIAAALDRDSGSERLAGFADALGDRYDEALVEPIPLYSYSAGRDGMNALLERAPDIDGVFAASDAVAAGAMEALRAAGRRVPADVGIVGFDDSAWARRTLPALSTVRQPAEGLGRQAAALVLEQLRGDTDAGRSPARSARSSGASRPEPPIRVRLTSSGGGRRPGTVRTIG